jgi:hypothetical protein
MGKMQRDHQEEKLARLNQWEVFMTAILMVLGLLTVRWLTGIHARPLGGQAKTSLEIEFAALALSGGAWIMLCILSTVRLKLAGTQSPTQVLLEKHFEHLNSVARFMGTDYRNCLHDINETIRSIRGQELAAVEGARVSVRAR